MNVESVKSVAKEFFVIIIVGALLSALVGGTFGVLIALVSPRFMTAFRDVFAYGMIWGVFVGAVLASYACFISAIMHIRLNRFEDHANQETSQFELR